MSTSSMSAGSVVVTPAPTDEEVAAIVAATEALWPRAIVEPARGRRHPTWKFSGRWWAVPLPARRARPWM